MTVMVIDTTLGLHSSVDKALEQVQLYLGLQRSSDCSWVSLAAWKLGGHMGVSWGSFSPLFHFPCACLR